MNSSNDLLEFTCPHCSSPVTASPELAGQRIQCGQCEKRLKVPGRPRSGSSTSQGPYGAPSATPVQRAPDPIASPPLKNDLEPNADAISSTASMDSNDVLVKQTELDSLPSDLAIESKPSQTKATSSLNAEAFESSTSEAQQDPTDQLVEPTSQIDSTATSAPVPQAPVPEVDIELDEPIESATNELGLADLDAPADLFGGAKPQSKKPTPQHTSAERRPIEKPPKDSSLEDLKTRFSMKCPVCDSVLYAAMGQIGSEIKCDDCYSMVPVSSPEKAKDTHYVNDVMSFDKDEYKLQPLDADDAVAEAISDAFLGTDSTTADSVSSTPASNPSSAHSENSVPDLLATSETSQRQESLANDVATHTPETNAAEDDIFFDINEPQADPPQNFSGSSELKSEDYDLEPIDESSDVFESTSETETSTAEEPNAEFSPIEEGIDLLAPQASPAKEPSEDVASNIANPTSTADKPSGVPASASSGTHVTSGQPSSAEQSNALNTGAPTTKSQPKPGWGQAKPTSERVHELTGEEPPTPENVEIDPPAKIRLTLTASDIVTDTVKIMMHPSMLISLGAYTMLTFIALSLITTFRTSLIAWNESDGMARFGPAGTALFMAMCAAVLTVFTTISFAAIATRMMRAVSSQDKDLDLFSEMGPWETLIDSLTLLVSSAIALAPGMLIGSAFAAVFGHSSFWCIGFVFYFFLVPFPLMSALRNDNALKMFDGDLYDSLRDHPKSWLLLFAVSAILTPVFVIAVAVHPLNSYILNVGIAVVVTPMMFFFLCVVSDSFNVIGNQINHAKRLKELAPDGDEQKEGFHSQPKPISSIE